MIIFGKNNEINVVSVTYPAIDWHCKWYFQHGIERAKLDQTIRDFRQGKINVIVSTAVLEEGNEKKLKTFFLKCHITNKDYSHFTLKVDETSY